MNEIDRDQLLTALIEEPDRRGDMLSDPHLSLSDRAELQSLAELADSIWLDAHGAPKLEDDPVAAMLGLVPDPNAALDPGALARFRKNAKLKASDIAQALRERGWSFDTSDVFRWETRSAHDVPPAVVQDLAECLKVPVESLLSSSVRAAVPPAIAAARAEPFFEQLAERWSRVRRIPVSVAVAALESRMLATVHRGKEPDTQQLLSSLAALVASVESSNEKDVPP